MLGLVGRRRRRRFLLVVLLVLDVVVDVVPRDRRCRRDLARLRDRRHELRPLVWVRLFVTDEPCILFAVELASVAHTFPIALRSIALGSRRARLLLRGLTHCASS